MSEANCILKSEEAETSAPRTQISAVPDASPSPTLLQRLGMWCFRRLASLLKTGYLEVVLPDRTVWSFGDAASQLRAKIRVKSYKTFTKILTGSDIGFGEAFVHGFWKADDLTSVLKLGIENEQIFASRLMNSRLRTFLDILTHKLCRNTKRGSRRNIHAHYDLGNSFYKTFLDETLSYSSAIFRFRNESLEQAQANKMKLLLAKAQLKPGMTLLEIGSGWGSLGILAAKEYGCTVHSITVSQEQLRLARERAKENGVEGKVTFEFCDYRDVTGKYDRIVSVEMLEAVGESYLGEFFRICDQLLNPNGLAVIQVISLPDHRYEIYRKRSDWIQRYIFPGGHLPSLGALVGAMSSYSNLMVENIENIGIHYAETLRRWRERFNERISEVHALGFDDTFIRTWNYYLSSCEAAFECRVLNDYQLVLTRERNKDLPVCGRLGAG